MLKKFVDIKRKSDWLLMFQLTKSSKKVQNFQPFFPPIFSALFSDITQSCLNCACTQENLVRFFSRMENGHFFNMPSNNEAPREIYPGFSDDVKRNFLFQRQFYQPDGSQQQLPQR